MRPGDHPEFFLRPAPAGHSRESTIRLDGEGRFWHDGAVVDHPRLLAALHRWIARHPTDGRFILSKGYDWTYFTVQDTPYFVQGVELGSPPRLVLSDGTRQPFPEHGYRVGRAGALYCAVKDGAFEARFTQAAQTALAPLLREEGDSLLLDLGDTRVQLPNSDQAEV